MDTVGEDGNLGRCRLYGRARSKLRREKGSSLLGWKKLTGLEVGAAGRGDSQSSLNQMSVSDWIVRSQRRC